MGWNKQTSRTKYDSVSGHGSVLGGNTKKIMQHKVLSKYCQICLVAEKNNRVVEPHKCPKNHVGSSKLMECEAMYHMVCKVPKKYNYIIDTIIFDDYSTMKANLKYSLEERVKQGKMSKSD